jgi:hypothetical protein
MSRSITRSLTIALLTIVFASNGCKQQHEKKYPPDFRQLPMHLGSWRGEENTNAAKNLSAIVQALYVVDRIYRDPNGAAVSINISVFIDWDIQRHDPILCYRAAGWEPLGEEVERIRIAEVKAIPVSISRWRNVIPQVQVLYWYQIEDKVLFHNEDVKKLPPDILDNKNPARLAKVMLSITEGDIEQSKMSVKDLAREIAKWIEQAAEASNADNR